MTLHKILELAENIADEILRQSDFGFDVGDDLERQAKEFKAALNGKPSATIEINSGCAEVTKNNGCYLTIIDHDIQDKPLAEIEEYDGGIDGVRVQ